MESTDRILIADDDREFAHDLRKYLVHRNFKVMIAEEIEHALDDLRGNRFYLVLIDIAIAGRNGFGILERLRESPDVELLFVTGPADDADRVIGFESGADDYLIKPFHPRELIARIHALRRRRERKLLSSHLKIGDITLDSGSRAVRIGAEIVDLTTMEFDLLEALARSAGRAVSREELSRAVLGRRFNPFDRSLDMLISRLRRKLQRAGVARQVKTVRARGYQLALQET